MKLFVLFLLVSNNLFEIFGEEDNAIENVYIDKLVQDYMSLESNLWNYTYERFGKTEDIIDKIVSKHSNFLLKEGLAYMVNYDYYKSKFEKFVNLTVLENYDEEHRKVLHLANQEPRILGSESYVRSDSIADIYNRTISNDLFHVIKEAAEKQNCSKSKTTIIESASQDLFMFYELITAYMLRSYAFTQRFNMVKVVKSRREIHKHDYTIFNTFISRYNKIAELARKNIQTSGHRDVWMCDSQSYDQDDESIQITNFLNGYVDNEINLNREGSCWNTCEDYRWTQNYGCSDGTFCDQQRRIGYNAACDGTIVDCRYIESSMKICRSIEKHSIRRYQYISFESKRHFGEPSCPSAPVSVSSWWNWFLMRCSYCFCYCDSHTGSDRYFSLQPAVSTIRKNKIITGVAITKRNGIFSWTIIQSKLLSNGRVEQLSDEFFDKNSEETLSDDERLEIVQNFKRTDFGIIEGVDYHTLSWQNRSINLATLTVPLGCVVTGIRFAVIKEHLNFEIRSTQFNFNTGLLYGRSEWISNKNEKRSILSLDRPTPSRPIRLNNEEVVRSVPDFTPNKFIKFRPSDPEKDAGQTTVPFIDPQMVRPKQLTLLSGVGIYYKGRPGYGGFIAPKIFVYDFASYLAN